MKNKKITGQFQHGSFYTAIIKEKPENRHISGRIRITPGGEISLSYGYKDPEFYQLNNNFGYSHYILISNPDIISINIVAPPKNFCDWQIGDKIIYEGDSEILLDVKTIIFRFGKLIIFEDEFGSASENYTCDELYNSGYRLFLPDTEKETIKELTLTEISEKFNIPLKELRIKE